MMSQRVKFTLISALIIIVFLVVVILYYFVYQGFMTDRRSEYTIIDDRPVISEGLSFQEDVKRFLEVYNGQEFKKKQDLYDFLVLELNRFSLYPVEDSGEKEIKVKLVSNITDIVEKMEKGINDMSQESANLLEIMETIN